MDDGQEKKNETETNSDKHSGSRNHHTLENVENDPDMFWGTGSASSKRQGEVTNAKAKEQHVGQSRDGFQKDGHGRDGFSEDG